MSVWSFCQIIRAGLSRHPVKLAFDIDDDLTCRVLEFPGLWMSESELSGLLVEIRSVCEDSEARELTYGVFSMHRGELDRRIITVINDRETGRPAGFTALCLLDLEGGQRAIHLGLAMVHRDFRGRGLTQRLYRYPWLLMVLRNRGRSAWISSVTQVPALFGMVGEACEDVYPIPGATGPGEAHRRVAETIMRDHRSAFGVGADAGFDRDRFIITNAYTGGSAGLRKTYAAAPKHRAERYNEMCLRQLDYARGDDFLQIGRVSARSLLSCLARRGLALSVASSLRPPLTAARKLVHAVRAGRTRRVS